MTSRAHTESSHLLCSVSTVLVQGTWTGRLLSYSPDTHERLGPFSGSSFSRQLSSTAISRPQIVRELMTSCTQSPDM